MSSVDSVLRALVAGFFTLAAATCAATGSTSPDIIMVVLDDFGHGYLSANFAARSAADFAPSIRQRDAGLYDPEMMLANVRQAMPTVDRLVAEGLRFSQAYATHSLCGPSRTAILTGRHSATFGVDSNIDTALSGMPAGAGYDYPAKAIRRQGYVTAAVGKWHARQAAWTTARWDDPVSAGFSSFYGFNNHGTEYYGSTDIYSASSDGTYRPVAQPEGVFLVDQFTDQAIKVLQRKRTGKPPVFLYLAYNAIHTPLRPEALAPPAYRVFNTGNAQADLLLSYMRAVDTGIARVMETQKQRGRLRDTLLLFVSDNGSPGDYIYVAPANSPFEGFKGQQYEGGLRVPMFAYWKGTIAPGRTYPGLVSTMDLMPTAMQAAGSNPAGLEGLPLQRLFSGTWPKGDSHHPILMSFGHDAGQWGLPEMADSDQSMAPGAWLVRTPRRVVKYTAADQYLILGAPVRGSPRLSMFAADDPAMLRDLALAEPDLAATIQSQFWQWFATLPQPESSASAVYWQDLKAAQPAGIASRRLATGRHGLSLRNAGAALPADVCRAEGSR